jgi:anthranilate phosphoribosyltransferase
MIADYIRRVAERENLSEDEAEAAMSFIMTGRATDSQIAAYLTALRMKGETVEEISGSARAMRAAASHVSVPNRNDPILDTCGTGGDGANTFNISTAAAFVIAGAGQKVAKHGNKAASSRCGSADVLAALGLNLDLAPEDVAVCIEEIGIGFMFAPRFHPAMKYAVGPRREIGIRTIFNILGPITNPARANRQLLGVFSPQLTEILAQVLNCLGAESALVVHGFGGLDELTTSGPNRVSLLEGGQVSTYDLDPSSLGFTPARPDALTGGSPEENADRMRALLSGQEQSSLRDVVLLNAAAGLSLADGDLAVGLKRARASLESLAALDKLEGLISLSRRFQPALRAVSV